MKKKMTSVSIVRETLPTELQCKIKELAKTSVDLGVSKERFVFEFTKARNRYLESLLEIPEEDQAEKEFRAKVNAFFEKDDLLPIGEIGYNNYQFYCANYHIEAVCAAYRLFNSGDNLSIVNIFNTAKLKMRVNENYMNGWDGQRRYSRCEWHLTSKKDNIQGLRDYFIILTDYILKCDKTLDKRCKAFLKEHEYRSSEEVWLKMIYIISNS